MLLGFKQQFAEYVASGSKTHTIRAHRKISPKVGEFCHCYTGLRQRGPIIQKLASGEVVRQKMSRLLGRFPLVRVQAIEIWKLEKVHKDCPIAVFIDGAELSVDETQGFFWRDGFRGDGPPAAQAYEFWEERAFPWRGQIFHWEFKNDSTGSGSGNRKERPLALGRKRNTAGGARA